LSGSVENLDFELTQANVITAIGFVQFSGKTPCMGKLISGRPNPNPALISLWTTSLANNFYVKISYV